MVFFLVFFVLSVGSLIGLGVFVGSSVCLFGSWVGRGCPMVFFFYLLVSGLCLGFFELCILFGFFFLGFWSFFFCGVVIVYFFFFFGLVFGFVWVVVGIGFFFFLGFFFFWDQPPPPQRPPPPPNPPRPRPPSPTHHSFDELSFWGVVFLADCLRRTATKGMENRQILSDNIVKMPQIVVMRAAHWRGPSDSK